MVNDKVEPWVEAFSAALDAKAEMGFIYLDNGMIVEELHRHAAPVLAERDRYRDGLLDELARIDVLVVEQDAEIARLKEENERYLNAMTKTVEYFPCGSINAGEIMKLAMEAKTDE